MNQNIVNVLNSLQGIRKVLVMLSLVLIGVIFRIKGYLDGSNFVDLLKATTIAFFASNGVEHLTSTIKEYINVNGAKVDETVVDVEQK
jgi:hypothetical protein